MKFNLLQLAEAPVDYSREKVLLPLSGGINSAAALCVLGEYHPEELKPAELHIFYSHFREHSPGTFRFVADQIRYARKKFRVVKVVIQRHSVNAFFLSEGIIPHPTISPCSQRLKIQPRLDYAESEGIHAQLVGFVRTEFKRYKRQQKYVAKEGVRTEYPTLTMTDEDCFRLVKAVVGWYPAIYEIRYSEEDFRAGLCSKKEIGKRVFGHNNCLPCKNMTKRQLLTVGRYFPAYAARAQATAEAIPGAYWGRDDVPDSFKCDSCERLDGGLKDDDDAEPDGAPDCGDLPLFPDETS